MPTTHKPVRMDRYSHRQVLTWEDDDDSGEDFFCNAEDLVGRVWLSERHWFFKVTRHGILQTSGKDKTSRLAQICCERWMREHFKKAFPI